MVTNRYWHPKTYNSSEGTERRRRSSMGKKVQNFLRLGRYEFHNSSAGNNQVLITSRKFQLCCCSLHLNINGSDN